MPVAFEFANTSPLFQLKFESFIHSRMFGPHQNDLGAQASSILSYVQMGDASARQISNRTTSIHLNCLLIRTRFTQTHTHVDAEIHRRDTVSFRPLVDASSGLALLGHINRVWRSRYLDAVVLQFQMILSCLLNGPGHLKQARRFRWIT